MLRPRRGGDPFVEGAQRSGGSRGVPGSLDKHMPGLARALLGDPAVPGRLRPRLTHPRVETQVADQMPGGREAPDVADRRQQRAGGHEVDTGKGQQPSQLGRSEHELGECPVDRRDLTVEELDPAQAGLDHLSLVGRQLLGGEPASTGGTEEVGRRRALLEVADQDRVHLVLLACALPHQLRAAGDPSTQDTRPLVRRPDLGQKAGREQLRERACVELVRLRRLRCTLDSLRVSEHDAAHVRLDDSGDRERVPGRLEHHLIIDGKALREQLERSRRRLDSPNAADLTTLCDRDLAEVAVHVERDEAHQYLLQLA